MHPHSVSSFSISFIGHSSIISHQSSVINRRGRPTPGEHSTVACRPVVSCTVRPYGFLTLWVRPICPRSQVGCRLQQRWPRRGQSQSPSLRLPCPLSSQLPTSRVSTSLRRRSFAVLSLRDSSPDSPFSPGWLRHESTIRSTSCSANIFIRIGRAYLSMPTANLARHRGSDCCCPRVLLMRLRFKQSIPRRPRPLASRGISWHALGIPLGIPLARNQGWPSRPSTIKHHQAAAIGAPTGGALMPLLPLLLCAPQRSFFVPFFAVSWLVLLVFQGWPDSALPATPSQSPVDHPDGSSMPIRWN